MTELYSRDNLFTTFNNIESVKKEKSKEILTVRHMVDVIQDTFNFNDAMLGEELGIAGQNINNWRSKNVKPTMNNYRQLKRLYEKALQHKKDVEYLEDKINAAIEVTENKVDITENTPFIQLVNTENNLEFIDYRLISKIVQYQDGCVIFTRQTGLTLKVKSTSEQLFELIRSKQNETK